MQIQSLTSNDNAPDRLARQLTFVAEIDKLKDVLRRNFVSGSRRNENSAEHSWHLALMALVLLEHFTEPGIDSLQILKLVLVHDIVEIDAGDTFGYDAAGHVTKADREKKAADRIFNLLPSDQSLQFRQLWMSLRRGGPRSPADPRTGSRTSRAPEFAYGWSRLATTQNHQGPNSGIQQTHRHKHAVGLGGCSSTDRSTRGASPLGQVTEENEQFFELIHPQSKSEYTNYESAATFRTSIQLGHEHLGMAGG
jgi:5'-deoxynucleotidase YfbR-like HD superfamily hydrolase